MTGVDVEHTKALEQKATAGPWEWDEDDWLVRSETGGPVAIPGDETAFNVVQRIRVKPADAEFIAHARTAVPALVAAVERVQALHAPDEIIGDYGLVYCRECGDYLPCPTIRALETP